MMGTFVKTLKIVGLVGMCIIFPLSANATLPKSGFWSFQLENDLWGSRDDRFYTHGTQVSFVSSELFPSSFDKIAEWLPYYQTSSERVWGFQVGQKIFTPEDISETAIITDDRPYAGWLFYETGFAHLYENTGPNRLLKNQHIERHLFPSE